MPYFWRLPKRQTSTTNPPSRLRRGFSWVPSWVCMLSFRKSRCLLPPGSEVTPCFSSAPSADPGGDISRVSPATELWAAGEALHLGESVPATHVTWGRCSCWGRRLPSHGSRRVPHRCSAGRHRGHRAGFSHTIPTRPRPGAGTCPWGRLNLKTGLGSWCAHSLCAAVSSGKRLICRQVLTFPV